MSNRIVCGLIWSDLGTYNQGGYIQSGNGQSGYNNNGYYNHNHNGTGVQGPVGYHDNNDNTRLDRSYDPNPGPGPGTINETKLASMFSSDVITRLDQAFGAKR